MATEIIQRQATTLREMHVDAMIASSPQNVAYTIQFMVPSHPIIPERPAASVVTADDNSAVLVANMEETTTKRYGQVDSVHAYVEFEEQPMDRLARLLSDMGLSESKIAVEMEYLPARDYAMLQERLPRCSFVAADNILARLRMVKTTGEIDKLRKVGRIASEVHASVYKKVGAGNTERDLAAEIWGEYLRRGGDAMSILVVASGDRSALPNGSATDRVLGPGELIRVDIIALCDYYYSDVARTIVVGEPNNEQRGIWRKIYDTHQMLLDMVKPGVMTSDLYSVFRREFQRYGFPVNDFVGHGLGLGLHEQPLIGKIGDHVLEENMVLCIEPFITYEKLGYHVEDEVLVTSTGYELLTKYCDNSQLLTTS